MFLIQKQEVITSFITSKKPKKSYELPRFVRLTSRLLTSIHWRLGLWFALKLFFVPLKFPIPRREKPWRKKATKHQLHTGKSAFTCFEWGSGEKKIILMHGWSGRATQFTAIIKVLLQKNYHVYSIEAPAHGESAQRKTHMLEFVDALQTVIKKFGPFQYAIGHSLGGMAIFNCLKTSSFDPKSIITIGTPTSIRNVVYDFCDKIETNAQVARQLIRYIEKRYSMKVKKASTGHLASRYNPNGLIIHDVNDLDVDIRNAKALKKKWPNAELLITEGLGHRKILIERKVVDAIVGFLPLS